MGVQVEELSDHLERVQVHLVHGVWAQDVGQEHWGILLHPCYRLLGQWETDTSPEEESFDRWWSSCEAHPQVICSIQQQILRMKKSTYYIGLKKTILFHTCSMYTRFDKAYS